MYTQESEATEIVANPVHAIQHDSAMEDMVKGLMEALEVIEVPEL